MTSGDLVENEWRTPADNVESVIIPGSQLMMTRVLVSEAKNTDLNIYSVMAMTPVNTRSRRMTRKDWPTAEEIGDYMVNLYNHPSANVLHKIP